MLTNDPGTAAGLVGREVRTGSRDGAPTRIVVARRDYPTDRSDLWNALTDPARIPRWFLPVSGDLRPGGRYQFEGNAGGVIERCDEPVAFAVTWEMGPMVSWLTVTLHAGHGGTTLELAHEAPVDPMWGEYGPGAVGIGWDLALLGLGVHLDTGEAVDPVEGQAFATSPTGIEFVAASSQGWADAAIADGDDPDAARAAAARTVTFYTVEPDGEPGV